MPDHNIGITCGEPSGGLVVIDIDRKEDVDGWETLKAWESQHGDLPETFTARTGSGGVHLYYRARGETVPPSVNQDLGVDIRGEGSYVVAPPSVHECGEPYAWEWGPFDDGAEIAEADENVMAFVDYVRPRAAAAEAQSAGRLELPETIAKGGRDTVLYKYACSLRALGRDEQEILAIVTGANVLRCKPPLEAAEVERLVKSACRHPAGLSPEYAARAAEKRAGADGAGADADEEPVSVRGKRGGIQHNAVARLILRDYHARTIDGAPAVWTGSRWEFGARAINRCVLEIVDDARKQDKAEVQSYIMDRAPSVTSDNAFDGRHYVQFANCTYDVLSGETVEPDPSMLITYTLPVELDLEQGPNLADDFLASVAGGDADVGQVLAEVIGAAMCPRRVVSQAAMLVGRAAGAKGRASNGKSTYLNWLRAILGTDNVSSLDIATLGQRFQAARIVGRAANLGDDIPDGFLRGEELSMFKKLVTGDSIYTDVKNGEGFEFRPSATMVFSMNAVPRLSDTTEGVFRRLAFVPFRATFRPGTPGYDPDLASKLARPEVLRRGALLGLMALGGLIRNGGGLHPVPDMVAEMEEVKKDNDSVLRWIDDCGITAEALDGRVVATVYDEYKQWCDESGERNPFSRRAWTARIREAANDICGGYAGYDYAITSKPAKVGGSSKAVRVFDIQAQK